MCAYTQITRTQGYLNTVRAGGKSFKFAMRANKQITQRGRQTECVWERARDKEGVWTRESVMAPAILVCNRFEFEWPNVKSTSECTLISYPDSRFMVTPGFVYGFSALFWLRCLRLHTASQHNALTAISVDSRWKHVPSTLVFLFLFLLVCSIIFAAPDRTSLAPTRGRKAARAKERVWEEVGETARVLALLLHFPVDCFPCRKTGSQWDIKGKAKPKQCYIYVCFAAWVCCVCVCAVTSSHPSSHQFLSTIRPSKHPFIPSAIQHPCIYPSIYIYPCSCPSVRLVSLASITMYHATHVFSLALYVGVKSLTCASIAAPLPRNVCCTFAQLELQLKLTLIVALGKFDLNYWYVYQCAE